ncbi:hypothetical protein Pelo_7734 [Pelomyxa schiedti]|nr:hypothetical protein Pelo_7734 [Pelomyxa schiedti]
MGRITKLAISIGFLAGEGNSTEWNSTTNWNSPGWGMKFVVDEWGNVSGGNTNEGPGQQVPKTYTGTFRQNHMEVTSNHGVLYVADVMPGEIATIKLSHSTAGSSLGRGRVTIQPLS